MHKKTLFFILALVGVFVVFSVLSGGQKSSVSLLPEAVETGEVRLKNGDIYELVASAVTEELGGKKVTMLAYNGSGPGPTIRVGEGDNVTIRFVNKTDMPTLLHSHGVRMANEFDGTHIVQPVVLPSETFDYVLTFTDPGVFWYHRHVREDLQQNMGLYGSFLVTPKDGTYWSPADHEETLFLSDVLMEDGHIAPYSKKYSTHALMGRFGNTLLVNGKTSYTIKAEPGEVHRLFVTNAATVRPFDFRIAGARMKLVGGDNGRYEKETFVESVLLGPSERAIVEVYFPDAGVFPLEHRTPTKTYTLGGVKVSGDPVPPVGPSFDTLRTELDLQKEFNKLRAGYGSKKPNK